MFLFNQGGNDFDQPMAYRQLMGLIGYLMDLQERKTEMIFATNSWVQSKGNPKDTFRKKSKDGLSVFINCK